MAKNSAFKFCFVTKEEISTGADGGPCSSVCACLTLRSAPHRQHFLFLKKEPKNRPPLNMLKLEVNIAVAEVAVKPFNEVCPDEEFLSCLEKVKKKCSIQLVLMNQFNIEEFRDSVEKYFEERKDIIENIVA